MTSARLKRCVGSAAWVRDGELYIDNATWERVVRAFEGEGTQLGQGRLRSLDAPYPDRRTLLINLNAIQAPHGQDGPRASWLVGWICE